ncbi:MAG: tRNA (guanosine(37)-N1)-methyltransferase TrmD [Bdellovibrionota bacterium]|nr:tRNA (guanosine(37)-N1)-methyltransferase TrmD [Deltaproteobacteria bacterium]
MRFDVVTLFPECFGAVAVSKIWQNAIDSKKLSLHLHQLRNFSTNKHKTVDDTPYGGGAGMLLQIEPLVAAIESIPRLEKSQVWLMSPQGHVWEQDRAVSAHADLQQIILVCGRYEGVDERFIEGWVDQCISIGNYVLSGGELAAMVVMESVSRVVPGVVGDAMSVSEDSIQSGGLKYPQFTRPREFRGMMVPEVLLQGDHQKIAKWREKQAHFRTLQNRPDLLKEQNILPTEVKGKTK